MNTITKSTYAWLTRTHAFFAGLEFLARHGYVEATRQWVTDHGYSQDYADVEVETTFRTYYAN